MTNEEIAFGILLKHPDCLRDDISLNDLITDIADAIGVAAMAGEQHGRIAEAAAKRSAIRPNVTTDPSAQQVLEDDR